MATVSDLITSALRELGIVGLTQTPGAELADFSLGLLNRMLDAWNADRQTVFADVHSPLLSFSAGVNPHTIGISDDSPTWTVTGHRPVSIEGIRITEDNGETFLAPLLKREAAWWHNVRTPGTPNAYPSDFYYDPTWPNGSIYFYPEPSSAAIKAQLWYRVPFAQVALTTDLSVPPAYRDAMTETLKERLTGLPMFASMASGDIKDAARLARSKAFGNNAPVQRMTTADLGRGGGGGAEYDHLLGPFSLMRGF